MVLIDEAMNFADSLKWSKDFMLYEDFINTVYVLELQLAHALDSLFMCFTPIQDCRYGHEKGRCQRCESERATGSSKGVHF